MGFHTGLEIGDEVTNADIVRIFKCGNMGGMRRSKATGTLVIISDDTKGLYRDEWIDGILHYTGMGKIGDQVLNGNQNGTLYYSDVNSIEVHLFEVLEKTVYTYRGVVVLNSQPYQAKQLDDNGNIRSVWIFPVKPIQTFKDKNITEKKIKELSNRELMRRFEINGTKRKPIITETTVYYRDPHLKEMVKRIAEGKCQYCGQEAPFIDKNGQPYLEEHHVIALADGGTDTMDNVVAICPNCHRKIHILDEEQDVILLKQIADKNEMMRQRLLGYENKVGRLCKKKQD